jgi:hypothetical protein
VHSALNMTVIAITSGAVLLCLLAVKSRLRRCSSVVTQVPTMIMNYIPLIFATAAILTVFAFAAEAGNG